MFHDFLVFKGFFLMILHFSHMFRAGFYKVLFSRLFRNFSFSFLKPQFFLFGPVAGAARLATEAGKEKKFPHLSNRQYISAKTS
jgi:hypothetical protein